MKKVLHILPSLEYGGTEAFIMNHYRCIDRKEMQFDFLVFSERNWPYLEEINRLGGRVFFATQPSLLQLGKFFKAFEHAIEEGGPYAAIHCHANTGNAVPLMCGAYCKIAQRISHSHAVNEVSSYGVGRRAVFELRRLVIRVFATQFLACSNEAGTSLYGRAFFDRNGTVIQNGIPLDRFIQTNQNEVRRLKQEFRIMEENQIILGNISRFDKNKNQLFLVKVFEQFLKIHPHALLILGGVDGGRLEEVQTYVRDNKLENSIRFIGKRNDVEKCLKVMDVFVFPSELEGLGIALLEAQAAGCLCFASTGVPMESDMGLGTAFYMDLAKGPEYWAEFMDEQIKVRIMPTEERIRSAFKERAFDVAQSTEKMVRCYEKG